MKGQIEQQKKEKAEAIAIEGEKGKSNGKHTRKKKLEIIKEEDHDSSRKDMDSNDQEN